MANPYAPNNDNFSATDAKARQIFEEKLSKIPRSVLNRSITIQDVYGINKAALYIPNIPNHLQLDFYFRHFNEIARGNYRAHSSKPHDVNRAIWYYEVSRIHSLSMRIDTVRYNIVVIAFIIIAKMLGQDTSNSYDTGADNFCKHYMSAWLSKTSGMEYHCLQDELVSVWNDCGFELCHFPDRARREMNKAMWELKQMVPESSTLRPKDLLTAVKENKVPQDVFEKEGPMLVLHWVSSLAREDKERKEMGTDVEMEALAGSFSNTNLVQMDQSLISDLLVEIEPGVVEQVLPDEDRKPWITPEQAISIVRGVKKDHLADLMQNISLNRD